MNVRDELRNLREIENLLIAGHPAFANGDDVSKLLISSSDGGGQVRNRLASTDRCPAGAILSVAGGAFIPKGFPYVGQWPRLLFRKGSSGFRVAVRKIAQEQCQIANLFVIELFAAGH